MTEPQDLVHRAQSEFAAISNSAELENAKARYLGKTGAITALMKE